MADHLTPAKRSWNMSRVHSANTQPERTVRSVLHKLGFRFRLHVKALPGKPDIVLPKHRTVIFVNGCLWHQHPGCKKASLPSNNAAFWKEKLTSNRARDKKNEKLLRKAGWKVIVIWQCEISRSNEILQNKLQCALTGCDSTK